MVFLKDLFLKGYLRKILVDQKKKKTCKITHHAKKVPNYLPAKIFASRIIQDQMAVKFNHKYIGNLRDELSFSDV